MKYQTTSCRARAMDSGDEALFLPHHVKIMKVALALVIIRQKPDGVSARDYTERLALQFNDKQDNWKERATVLQRELLRTRQELLKYQIAGGETPHLQQQLPKRSYLPPSHTHNTQSHPTHIQLQALHQHLSSQESGYSSSLPGQQHGRPGLRYDVNATTSDEEERSSTGRTNFPSSNGAVASLASGGGDTDICGLNIREGNGTKGEELRKGIKAHVQFCSSVSALIHTRHQLSNLTTSDLRVALRDTILEACEGLTEAVRNSDSSFPLQQDLLDKAAKCIVDSIRMPLMSPFEENLIEASVALVNAIVERIMRQKTATKEFSQGIHSLFHVLCGVPRLFGHTVVTMTEHLVSCAQTLNKALEDCSSLVPDVVNNTGALLGVLDSLLQTYEVSTVLTDDVRLKVIEDLETSLVELSESFPLFTYAVWRVIAQLSCLTL